MLPCQSPATATTRSLEVATSIPHTTPVLHQYHSARGSLCLVAGNSLQGLPPRLSLGAGIDAASLSYRLKRRRRLSESSPPSSVRRQEGVPFAVRSVLGRKLGFRPLASLPESGEMGLILSLHGGRRAHLGG